MSSKCVIQIYIAPNIVMMCQAILWQIPSWRLVPKYSAPNIVTVCLIELYYAKYHHNALYQTVLLQISPKCVILNYFSPSNVLMRRISVHGECLNRFVCIKRRNIAIGSVGTRVLSFEPQSYVIFITVTPQDVTLHVQNTKFVKIQSCYGSYDVFIPDQNIHDTS